MKNTKYNEEEEEAAKKTKGNTQKRNESVCGAL